jgi:hypothetical protein
MIFLRFSSAVFRSESLTEVVQPLAVTLLSWTIRHWKIDGWAVLPSHIAFEMLFASSSRFGFFAGIVSGQGCGNLDSGANEPGHDGLDPLTPVPLPIRWGEGVHGTGQGHINAQLFSPA